MQSTGIQPSQLLMEVLAGAQEKIGQGISKSGFSQQLYEQHQLVQNASLGQLATLTQQPNQSSNAAAAPKESSPELPSEGWATPSQPSALRSGGKIKGSLLSSAASRNLVVSKWKISQELTFTDPLALENVLAQFHLAPSVSAAIRNTLDDNGRISLQKLTQVLDRVSSSQSELPPDGRAAADQIRSLLTGLLQQNQLPVQSYQALEIRTKSTYDFGEFRDLLRRLVEHIAKANVKQSGKPALQHPSGVNSSTDKPATEEVSTSRARLPNQTKSLAANLIPSFLREERDPLDKLKTSILEMATLPLSDGQSTQLPFPAANKIDYREGFGGERKSGQWDGATGRFEAADSGSPATWVSVMGGLPHVFLEAFSKISLTTPLEASAGPDFEVASMEALPFSPTIGAGNPTVWAANSPLNSARISKENPLPLTTSTPDNVFSAGERVIGALRPAPMEQDFNTESNLTAPTLFTKTSVPVVEKIAAPARADFTYNQSDSSGNRDSVSEYPSTASQQYPQRPAGILAETASANGLPEFSVKYPKELVGEVAERPTPAAGSEPNERPTAPLSAKVQNPKELFRDVTRLQMTTPASDVSAKATIPEPAGMQSSTEIPRDAIRLQMASTPAATGERSALNEPAKVENSGEFFRDVTRLQMTTPSSDVSAKATTPEQAGMQSSTEIPRAEIRLQMASTPAATGERSALNEPAKVENSGELLRDRTRLQMTTPLGDTGANSHASEPAQAQNPRELFRDLPPSQMTTPSSDASAKATTSEPAGMQSSTDIPRDAIRLQTASTPAATSERSAHTALPKAENSGEFLRDATPSQMTTPPSDVNAKAATPETFRMQSSAENARDAARLQATSPPAGSNGRTSVITTANVEQLDKPIQSIVFSEYQTSDQALLSTVTLDPLPPRTTAGKPAAAQTPGAGRSAEDTSYVSSNTNPPRPMPVENNASTVAIKSAGSVARDTLGEIGTTQRVGSDAHPTVSAGPLDVREILSSDLRNQAQVSTTEKDSVSTGVQRKSVGHTAVAGEPTSALSDERSFDPAKLPEGYVREQTRSSMLSSGRSSNTLQEPETSSDPQNGVLQNTKDPASRSETERAVPQPVRSNTLKDLIQPASNATGRDFGQSDAQNLPTDSKPGIAEPQTSAQTLVRPEALPPAPKPNLQNSVELLANNSVEKETTAGKNAPAIHEVAEPASRFTSIEPNSSEAPTHKNLEKAVQATQTSDQSPRQEQGQERTPLWFKESAQMMSAPAASSAGRAADMFSSYASSLASELAQRIQELYQQKRHELTLELEPKHLGRLLIKIGTDDNQVKTVIATESEQIKELLTRSAPVLRQELASQGLVLDKLQIDVNSQAAAQDHSFQHRNPGRRRNGPGQELASSGKGLAEAGVRRIHIGNAETLLSLFV